MDALPLAVRTVATHSVLDLYMRTEMYFEDGIFTITLVRIFLFLEMKFR